MTHEEVYQLANLVQRFNELKSAADSAELALRDFRYAIFDDTLSDDELATIKRAREILMRVSGETGFHAAIAHYEKLKAKS